jgi:hypothetical protein
MVDLRTDLTPGVDFDRVEVRLEPGDRVSSRAFAPDDTDVRARRVAELSAVDHGELRLETRLELGGTEVASRTVLIRHGGPRVVTVLVTRSCAGVQCEAPDTTCIGSECGSVECVTGEEPSCPEQTCRADEECPGGECTRGACLGGSCFVTAAPGACGAEQVCTPNGCVDATPVDAGALDAGRPDAGTPDAGALDGGLAAGLRLRLACGSGGPTDTSPLSHALDCTPPACPSVESQDPFGEVCAFDGIDDRLTVDPSAVGEGGAFSLAGWLRARTAPVGSVTPHVLVKPPGVSEGLGFSLYAMSDPDITVRMGFDVEVPGTTMESSFPASELAADWVHIAVTFDGTLVSFYRDGMRSSQVGGEASAADPATLTVGAPTGGGSADDHWDGWMWDLRFYDRALTEAEVAVLATRP